MSRNGSITNYIGYFLYKYQFFVQLEPKYYIFASLDYKFSDMF